jgi:hypothetical protein
MFLMAATADVELGVIERRNGAETTNSQTL